MFSRVKDKWLLFFLVLALTGEVGNCYVVEPPIIQVEMEKAGMHRSLTYRLRFDYPLVGKGCEYALLQAFPASVYISTDELDDLQRLKRLSAVYPKFVNIEVATERAQPFSVLLRGTPKITETLALPVHFRYHAPSDKRSAATVAIPLPELYLNCPMADSELIENELVARPDKLYCLNAAESRFDENVVKDGQPTTMANLERCNWRRVHVDCQLKTPLRAEIPVGQATAYGPVLCATILLGWSLALWTIIRSMANTRRINQRLNEQRLLQQKVK
ncbi:phosphatidylinositol-glycan biosynthesis class X protein [Drosophila suzukii]|uniref:Phosphatidylinositol-glycan biosynthesis class X protein n=1 Tax=Drosophila suzukii TaxID=28584 RepID=A0AB39ZUK7_DROSZ